MLFDMERDSPPKGGKPIAAFGEGVTVTATDMLHLKDNNVACQTLVAQWQAYRAPRVKVRLTVYECGI